jgi:antitoxin component YwqK of YwqJK toxin-antitoxin module
MSNIQIPDDKSSAIMITDKHGVTRYLNEFGQLHRDGDLPAVIESGNRRVLYYQNGLLHRDNKPACISDSQESYYQHGTLHRDNNLPAVINYVGKDDKKTIFSEEYFRHGVHHRDNGPAIQWATGAYQYYQNGLLHNETGPASHSIKADGVQDNYYLNGKYMTKTGFKIATLRNNLFSHNSAKPKI